MGYHPHRRAAHQNPAPRPRETSNQTQRPELSDNNTSKYQRNAQPPAPPLQNFPTSIKSASPTATNTPNGQDDKDQETIVVSTVVQAICAVALVVFTGLLACYGYRSWQAALTAANAAKTAANVASRTLQASRCAVVNIDPIMTFIDYQTRRSTVYFEVHNSGPTRANIQEQNFYPWYHPTEQVWPVQQPFSRDGKTCPLPEILESHQTMDSKEEIDVPLMMVFGDRSAWELYALGGVLLCFSGYVRYLDEAGDPHETRICDAWNIMTKRFSSLPEMPRSYNRRS
jgi:hypothetical protein